MRAASATHPSSTTPTSIDTIYAPGSFALQDAEVSRDGRIFVREKSARAAPNFYQRITAVCGIQNRPDNEVAGQHNRQAADDKAANESRNIVLHSREPVRANGART